MSPSQCDRILAVLKDGNPHRMEEIHQQVGFCRLNSRVSELRDRGHRIVCDKTGGHYTYQLHPVVEGTEAKHAGEKTGDDVGLTADDAEQRSDPSSVPSTTGEQLRLVA